MKRQINPKRIIWEIEENFKDELSKPKLKNLILSTIAISKTDKLRINRIANNIPVKVKHKKSKQNRLMRFLKNYLPLDSVTFSWTKLVLKKVYVYKKTHRIMVLVDEVSLIGEYKALVAAIPFRKRAIPIVFKIFTDQQINDMLYRSKNDIIWNFIDQVHDTIRKAQNNIETAKQPVYIFDRGFSDVKFMEYLDYMGMKFIMRVRKNTGITVEGRLVKLSDFGKTGYFRNVLYHSQERIRLNLFCAEEDNNPNDPVFIVSNIDDGIGMLYRLRMRIEELFRDLKSLFGFRHLVLKETEQSRVEQILLIVIIGMGIIFMLYEKSGYRWSKYYNSSSSKDYSLIHVIAEVIRVSWAGIVTSPWFSLNNADFY